ncbi:biotin--[acetyl-CoA-carboxylase] ligase [bacterium DOLJORAL78_65_58]|nr:MAG: biotin--[acetyl-CoA-carboxylase] ligase [bacterium DOLZORAL124_64_63]PIE76715.1 MAG: biotin--[acetyl-CoA-carboxylase] ligase [bacterium DOLJORAL78_65_58]
MFSDKPHPMSRDWFGLDVFESGARFRRTGARLYLLEDVPSTNDFLLGRGPAAQGRLCHWRDWGWQASDVRSISPVGRLERGTVVVARRQSAGKGRQGRSWVDCGGLNLSVVIPEHIAARQKGFSVWLGLMVVLALREEFSLDARLKWPNDILVGKRKLGGILLEHPARPGGGVVAGLGMNLSTRPEQFPPALQGTATSVLAETGRILKLGILAGVLVRRVEDEFNRFAAEGWLPWQASLSALDCLLGREVRIRSGERLHEGRSLGIGPEGTLLLDEGGARPRVLHAGEVHLLGEEDFAL